MLVDAQQPQLVADYFFNSSLGGLLFEPETNKPRHFFANATKTTRNAFGACLMVKDDNDLLYEWLAYHYTVLPLGHIVVGSDVGNSQDPQFVLGRWRKARVDDLSYTVLQPDEFIHRHGNYYEKFNATTEDDKEDALSLAERKHHHHHALIYRQKGFLTACSELLKEKGFGWTVYIDSDEFVAMNPLSKSDENLTIGGKGHFSITNTSFEIRRDLLIYDNNKTVLDIVLGLQRNGNITNCYTMPRLLVGALENRTCPDEYQVTPIQQLAKKQLGDRFTYMSTLRFFQHAKKGDFALSKFGKVLMDLSEIPDDTIRSQQPRNIHRPYAAHCGPAGGAHFPDSFFYVSHYIGSWERYASRSDHRRNRVEWEERAFVDDDSSACESSVHYLWFPRFLQRIGEKRAKFLLHSTKRR
jgi:hypothetical protein